MTTWTERHRARNAKRCQIDDWDMPAGWTGEMLDRLADAVRAEPDDARAREIAEAVWIVEQQKRLR